MTTFERYHDAIRFLEGLSNLPLAGDYMIKRSEPEIYLKRMRSFLDSIGAPDTGMKFIHITGTSGKGSVTTMVHEIIQASGTTVGSFTSPFVTTSIEKIRVGPLYIAPNELADIVEFLKPHIDTAYLNGAYGRPSYFEIFFAIALIYFKKKHCDYVVLEVGLGGRYDATNVIKKPLVTAITCIDYDHMAILGATLQKIARDKAGIIKSGSSFFTTETRLSLKKIFRDICKQEHASYNEVLYASSYVEANKALASAIGRCIGISERQIAAGIKRAQLPARFETVQKTPHIIIDGAHNRSKMRSTVSNLKRLTYKRLHVVFAMVDDKDHDLVLAEILPLAETLFLTRFQIKDRKCAHPKELAARSKRYLQKRVQTHIFLDPHRALDAAMRSAGAHDLILVTGSFYLAGELRSRWFNEERVLRTRRSFSHR